MTLSLLLLTASLAQYSAPVAGNTNEDMVQACISTCYAYADTPGFELKGCIVKCQELAKP